MQLFSLTKSIAQYFKSNVLAPSCGLTAKFRSFQADKSGATAIIVAIALPVVIGMAGLAIEYGSGLMVRSQNQRTADVAAYASALTYTSTAGDAAAKFNSAQNEARHLAGIHGIPQDQITLRMLSATRLEVIIRQAAPLALSRVINPAQDLNVEVRTVARVGERSSGFACVLALSTSSGSQSMFGSAVVNLQGCTVGGNGPMDIRQTINANCASPTAGTITGCRAWNESGVFPDPYNISWAEALELCRAAGRSPLITNLDTQRNLGAGPHCIDQSFNLTGNNTTNGTSGVTFFFNDNVDFRTGGNYQLDLRPVANLDLSPIGRDQIIPGLLFYGPRADFTSRGGSTLAGIGCFGITMRRVDIGGSATLSGECPDGVAAGGGDPRAIARLLE